MIFVIFDRYGNKWADGANWLLSYDTTSVCHISSPITMKPINLLRNNFLIDNQDEYNCRFDKNWWSLANVDLAVILPLIGINPEHQGLSLALSA